MICAVIQELTALFLESFVFLAFFAVIMLCKFLDKFIQ